MTDKSTGDLAATVAALERRIARLEDERAILDTLHRYGPAIDQGMADVWAGLFTEDGEFLCLGIAGEVIIREQGRAALAAWARAFAAGESRKMKHCLLDPVIAIDGDEARVESYFSNLVEHEDRRQPPHVRYMGRYRDRLLRGADGRWRFSQRVSISEAPAAD